MQRCFICIKRAEPHHFKSRGAGGSDLESICLCRRHHDEIERIGRYMFFKKNFIDATGGELRIREFQIKLLQGYIELLESKF
jgi:hypothetical protein